MISIASPRIGKAEIDAVVAVMKSGNLTQGKVVKAFEEKFSSYIGSKYGIAASSGTSALVAGIEALGIKEGDEVITTPFTFIATSNSVLYSRAKPVFADIDGKSFNIDPVSIESKITDKTKALLVVHLYGQPCRMDEIKRICKDHGLLLVEDCAQAHGAEYEGRKVGTFGDFSMFSFYATKNMITGEGGMVLTDEDSLSGKVRVILNQGQVNRYDHVMIGYNNRMTDMQAAIGIEQLKRLESMNRKRAENAKFLSRELSGVSWLEVPFIEKNVKHAWHQYTIKVPEGRRDRIFEYLNSRGVGARIYYPKPCYLQPAYQTLGYSKGICPVAESVSKQVLSLPVHPSLTKGDLVKIVEIVKSSCR
jgi:perosamine synthetase